MILDDTDIKILVVVQNYPTATMAELAGMVGLSQTPCWRRLKAMEDAGVVLGKAVLLDPLKIGLPIVVFAHLKIGGHDENTLNLFEEEIRAHPEIVECFSIAGESDYVLRVVARSIEDYERFLKKTLLHLPGVNSIVSNFAMKTVKITTVLPVRGGRHSKDTR